MKLLFLCKRRPMGRDLLSSPYGRFHYLPALLAERGHAVGVALLDYERAAPARTEAGGMLVTSCPAAGYLRHAHELVRAQMPDWVVGFSDTYFGILAARLARKYSRRCCIDAYDNYESYVGWAAPLHWLWRRSLRRADLVTAAGPHLLELMLAGRPASDGEIVPMAADPTGFEPRDRQACRRDLGLPDGRPLVGYCGSMHASRGVDVLFDAIPRVLSRRPDVGFVHSGRTWKNVPLPDAIHSLGYLPDDKVPTLLNSMDLLVVINRRSAFGEHSHPVKLYEAMRCEVPVLATRTMASSWILRDRPECLIEPDDPGALADAILSSLGRAHRPYADVPTWSSSCDSFERALAARL